VEEGETGGGVGAVPEAVIRAADPAAINNMVEFTPHRWTTAIVLP
jgi:hypothetical protein